jgi:hypothetical protein
MIAPPETAVKQEGEPTPFSTLIKLYVKAPAEAVETPKLVVVLALTNMF